jgi:hypothetical protein
MSLNSLVILLEKTHSTDLTVGPLSTDPHGGVHVQNVRDRQACTGDLFRQYIEVCCAELLRTCQRTLTPSSQLPGPRQRYVPSLFNCFFTI